MEVANDHEPEVRAMSVTVTVRFPVSDVAKAIEGLHSNAKFLEEISESTRGAGLLHHRFVSGDGELMVIDEWETAEQFQSFFDGNPKVAEVMASIGATGPPEITLFGSIDAAGTV
jgi:heme-degrading monooxygenase HmoA